MCILSFYLFIFFIYLYFTLYLLINLLFRPNGNIMEIPPSSVLISMPKLGDIVTFSFEAKTRREIPTNPKIFRIRTDLVWNDVVNGYLRENYLNSMPFYFIFNFSFISLKYILFAQIICYYLFVIYFY